MADIYPNEQWPAAGAVEALDGTTDRATGLPYIAKGTNPSSVPSYQVQYQRRERRLNQIVAPWRQGHVVDEGALRIGVYPVEYTLGGVRKRFVGATAQAVADESVRCVYLDVSNMLRVQEAFPSDLRTHLPLARITTSGGVMEIEDRRVWTAYGVPEFTGSIAGTDLASEVADAVPSLELSVGVEYSNSIWVTAQGRNAAGNALGRRLLMRGWLGSAPYDGEIATSPNTDFTLHTGTVVKELTTNKHFLALSDENGRVVFDVQETTARTFYLMVELDGRVYASGAIAFA